MVLSISKQNIENIYRTLKVFLTKFVLLSKLLCFYIKNSCILLHIFKSNGQNFIIKNKKILKNIF